MLAAFYGCRRRPFLCKIAQTPKGGHGLHAKQVDWLTDPLKKYIVPCTLYPDAVICGVSALTYHDLTDEEERQVWIALPAWPPKLK